MWAAVTLILLPLPRILVFPGMGPVPRDTAGQLKNYKQKSLASKVQRRKYNKRNFWRLTSEIEEKLIICVEQFEAQKLEEGTATQIETLTSKPAKAKLISRGQRAPCPGETRPQEALCWESKTSDYQAITPLPEL